MRIFDMLAEIFTPSARHMIEERDSRESLRQQAESGDRGLGVDLDAGIVVVGTPPDEADARDGRS